MSFLAQILSFILLLAGVGFIIAAAIGVLRFSDALQRMHASTKAGTLGAILVLGGTILALDGEGAIVGMMAIVFMLLTVPVAAHLLGRAAYVSGTPLRLVTGRNGLYGILERQGMPLEERTEFVAYAPASRAAAARAPLEAIEDISEVRLALIAPDVAPVVSRSLSIRARNNVPLKAIAVVDEAFLQATGDVQGTRAKVRENVARAIEETEALLPKRRSFFTLSYEEGNPMRLIPSRDDRGSLLVLPNQGWCHHGVELATPLATGRPEGLLRLSDHHAGSVLYLGRRPSGERAVIAICDDGSDEIVEGVDWALRAGLWENPSLLLVGYGAPARMEVFAEIAGRHGAVVPGQGLVATRDTVLPDAAANADALITAAIPRPKRVDWYGLFWHDTIASGWTGEVLIIPRSGKPG